MAYKKFRIGLKDTSSTPTAPVIDGNNNYIFIINPKNLVGTWRGGILTTNLSGLPRISSIQPGKEYVTWSWQKITAAEKRDILDYYFLVNETLVAIDDQRYSYEAVVIPSSYQFERRRSKKNELESYTAKVQLMLLGPPVLLSVSAWDALGGGVGPPA